MRVTRFIFAIVCLSIHACSLQPELPDPVEGDLDLTVTVKNIVPTQGVLRLALYNSDDFWLKEHGAIRGRLQLVSQSSETITFPGLRKGKYAVAVFHDVNGDNKLNKFLGFLPKEGYGFSNNASGPFGVGLPSFDKAALVLSASKKIELILVMPRF